MSLRPYTALLGGLFFSNICTAAPEVTPFALLEVESSALKSQGSTQSDIVLATFNAGFEAKLNNFSANASVLYEENETDLEVDEAYIQWNFAERFSGKFGQCYLPFGQFNTALVNDTLVLEVAETRESGAILAFAKDSFTADVYLYNGEVDGPNDKNTGKNDQADNYGVDLGFQSETLNLSLGYTSNLLDSDGLQGQAAEFAPGDTSAWIISGDISLSDWTLIAEHLVSRVDADSVMDGDGNTLDFAQNLRASQIEVNYTFNSFDIAASYQRTADALWLGLPKTRIALGAGCSPEEHTALKVELWQDTDYSIAAGGSGENSVGLVAQLAFEF